VDVSLEEVADCFCRGFCYTRSFTHPYLFSRLGKLRVLQDGPRNSGDQRKVEIVSIGMDPQEVCDAIRELKPPRFFACPIDLMDADFEATKRVFKANHFRCLGKEPLFVLALGQERKARISHAIQRVTDPEQANRVKVAAGSRQILERDLHDGEAGLRLYAAFEGDEPIAWVKSIPTGEGFAWVSNLYVQPAYRRRGLGMAIMNAMLEDDESFGIKWSVLLASSVGTHLYGRLGYEQVGLLQLFAPKKELWGIAPYR
jgi:GNAT superfamily N-acetyltransferase